MEHRPAETGLGAAVVLDWPAGSRRINVGPLRLSNPGLSQRVTREEGPRRGLLGGRVSGSLVSLKGPHCRRGC